MSCEPDFDGRSVLAVASCGWEGFSFGCPCPWAGPWVAAIELWLTRLLLPVPALSPLAAVELAVAGVVMVRDDWVACFAVAEAARAAAADAEAVAGREVLAAGGWTGRGCSCGVGRTAALTAVAMAVVVVATAVLTTTAGVGDAGQPCMGKSKCVFRTGLQQQRQNVMAMSAHSSSQSINVFRVWQAKH